MIVGDDDGVLCVPYAQTQAIYEAAMSKQAVEERLEAILAGRDDRKRVDATLNRLGCVTVP